MIVTTINHQQSVLSAVLALAQKDRQAAVKRASYITFNLRVEHFTPPYDIIFKALLVYYRTVEAVITYEHFIDILKRRVSQDDISFGESLSAFAEMRDAQPIEENEFRFQVVRLKELTKVDKFVDTLVDTMDILMQGKRSGGKLLFGYDAAVSTLQKRISELDEDFGSSAMLMGKDMNRVIAGYSDRKFGRVVGYNTSYPEVDDATSGGFQPGDLTFLAGYTSEGKSTLLNTLVDHWVFGSKLNVLVGTAEHSPEVVQRRLVSIRSADPRYGGVVVPYKLLKEGRLSNTEEHQLERIVQDMANNDSYGNYAIFSIPHHSTVSSIFEYVKIAQQLFHVHIFAWDYIGYTSSEVRRNTDREEIGHVVRATKVGATSFNGGKGLAVVSPYQISRGKWEKALKDGYYTLACMEESSATEKAADVVWSVLVLPEQSKTVGQVLKNRDGPRFSSPFDMPFDTQTMRFVPRSRGISL